VVVSPIDDKSKTVVIDSTTKVQDRKKRKLYEHAWKFQDTWIIQLPWAKSMFDDKGQVH